MDLNMKVRDLRDIPRKWVDLKKSLKNSVGWGVSGVFRWRTGIRELSVNLT